MFDSLPQDHNFPVELVPTPNAITGEQLKDSYQVIRTDTNEVLGVHGSRYKIVKHDDVVNSIIDSVNQADISKDFTTDVQVYDNGRKLRGTILFNDLTIEPSVGDYTKFKVDFFNSYDASWSFCQQAAGYRLICLNGMVSADAVARTKYKHTTSINVEGSANKVSIGLEAFLGNQERWAKWSNQTIGTDSVSMFFKATVAKTFTRQRNVTKTNEKQLEVLLGLWDNEKAVLGSNLWALYNCLTYWSTHTHEARTPHIASFNREVLVAKAMKSHHWHAMEVGCDL